MKKMNLNTTLKFKNTLRLFAVSMLFAGICISAFAQENVILHSEVGDTIDVVEKIDYLLFPGIPDSVFVYGTINQVDEVNQLNVFDGCQTSVNKLSPEAFQENAQNVEKLSAYYKTRLEKDTTEGTSLLVKKDSIPMGLNIEWMSSKQKDKMVRESYRYNSLKLDADEMGLMGAERERYIQTGGEMQFPLSK